MFKLLLHVYSNCSKNLNTQFAIKITLPNSIDPDQIINKQSGQGLHYLQFNHVVLGKISENFFFP